MVGAVVVSTELRGYKHWCNELVLLAAESLAKLEQLLFLSKQHMAHQVNYQRKAV